MQFATIEGGRRSQCHKRTDSKEKARDMTDIDDEWKTIVENMAGDG